VNVIGFQPDEFPRVIEELGDDAPVHGFELNVSCPNTKAGGSSSVRTRGLARSSSQARER
jgi:dihydroorotate dehydrogenase